MLSQHRKMMGNRIWGGQPQCNQGHPQYSNQTQPSNHSWPAVRVVNMEDHRVNCPDGLDGGDLEDGVGDM